MPPDAARYAAMSDPDRNPAFQRLWQDPCQALPAPSPAPFVSIGDAAQRIINRIHDERLRRQIREVFGE
jgi:hypothetical protein